MEAYYSSDEEIAWGPLTLKEVKKELGKEPRKIERRHSDLVSYSIVKTWEPIKSKEFEDSTRESGLFDFDDTLKEMEMALRYGLDYDSDVKMDKETVFQKPSKPVRARKSKKYDYVVSPVAMYIKTGDFDTNKENVGRNANVKKAAHKSVRF